MKLRDEIKANDLVLFASGGLVEWVLVLNVFLGSAPSRQSCRVRTQGGETFTTNVRRLVRPMDLSKARERLIRITLKEKSL